MQRRREREREREMERGSERQGISDRSDTGGRSIFLTVAARRSTAALMCSTGLAAICLSFM